MTATAAGPAVDGVILPDWAAGRPGRPGLESLLGHLERAIEAARVLGIPAEDAERVRDDAAGRLGYPADVYVLALVGGTGVGKSSLLNALAGVPVSRASVRRPTTDRPVAWVPGEAREDLRGLLEWLAVDEVHEHSMANRAGVAVLDLPDMDSLATEHRERVDAILPRVDAVAWVTDPEKYHDAALHDEFLGAWLPRLDTQAIVVNKSDRLEPSAVDQVRRDIERDLVRAALGPLGGRVPVLVASAAGGVAGTREVNDWLDGGLESKRIVRARLSSAIVSAIDQLARAAEVDPRAPARPILEPTARRAAIDAATEDALRAIDLAALERQAVAATRARARARGSGPVGLLTSAVYRLSGREARVADPGAFLTRWRERGPLGPAVESLRQPLIASVRSAAPAVRPALAAAVEPGPLGAGLGAAIDRAVARHDRTVPTSRLWPVIGALQTLATASTALAVAWIVVWILARPPVDSVQVPLLGSVPAPGLLLVASVLAGYLCARLLGLHAGWLGRRWSARLRRAVADAIGQQVRDHALEPLDRLEAARRALWVAARSANMDARRL